MDATERRLLLHLLTKAGGMSPSGHAAYRLYPRKTRKKDRRGRPIPVYCFALWDAVARRWETAQSTGQTTRSAAETWAAAQLAGQKESRETVSAFAGGLFDEESEYLIHRAERGRPVSWNHRQHCATYLEKYILPYFGKYRLADLTALDIERFQSWLLKQPARGADVTLSPSTCNHVTHAFRLVTKWAIRQRLIAHDPFVGVETLSSQPKRRGILEPNEVQRIFALGTDGWPDPLARVLNLLAAVCKKQSSPTGATRHCSW